VQCSRSAAMTLDNDPMKSSVKTGFGEQQRKK